MAEWIEPIFDRAQTDIVALYEALADWKAEILAGNTPNMVDMKGALNVSDLNRIEGDITYLTDTLIGLQYKPITSSKSWVSYTPTIPVTQSLIPNTDDVKRILENVSNIIDAYISPRDAPPVPTNMKNYEEINDIEENLYLIKESIDAMLGLFQKSDRFKSNAHRDLPLLNEIKQ